ncbi:hypothetical protein JCM10207_005697 [Rhodosporidiobolus poonsookiae]
MPALSGLQTLLAGLAYVYAGVSLLHSPASFLQKLAPLTILIEDHLDVKPYVAVDEGLAGVGVGLVFIGYFFVMAVYTNDAKFKHNSVSGRLLAAFASYYACTQTPYGSSLVALLGLFNLASGALLGLSIGFGDGNVVDLELKKRVEARRRAEGKK